MRQVEDVMLYLMRREKTLRILVRENPKNDYYLGKLAAVEATMNYIDPSRED